MSAVNTQVQLSDGAKLNVWLLGAENKSKPLIISLHGAPGLSTHSDIKEGFKFLANEFRVLVYDHRGSGGSDLKGPFKDEQWIADVDELRAWAGDEKFVLAGGSYGGFLALNYAISYPKRLLGLILRNTWASGPLGTHRALANLLSSHRVNPDPIRQARLWSGNLRDKRDAEESLAEIVSIYTPERPDEQNTPSASFEGAGAELRWEVHNAAFSYSQPRFDVRDKLGEIKVPTLVVVGRLDVICPVEESEMISKGIPNSELVVFENSAHNPATDEPEVFQRVLSEFLEKMSY
ncbi:Proline iminopeptidase [Fusarium austroafricanum]|uniref:Proline iminopeptidase n=1 Tax=Fusarium austroafricanum TaxID=2364996 RepID=A0A8H4KE57_9HYPO|nr:Proline iminopeptidase [Fusarium austroafricanum]